MDPIEPTPEPASPRDPIAFGRLLREGEAARTGSMPAKRDALIRAEIRADFGLAPEDRPAIEPDDLAPNPFHRRVRRFAQGLAAVAAVAVIFLLMRDYFLPGGDVASDSTPASGADGLIASNGMAADSQPAGETASAPTVLAAAPTVAGASAADRLRLATAARGQRLFDGLDALMASLVVAVDLPVAVASPDLPAIDVSGVEVVPASVRLLPPANPEAAFGVWQVEVTPSVEGPIELAGWRIAVDLGGLDVVAIGDGVLPGFTSPPVYDAATLARGTLVLAAVSTTPRSCDGPIVVARLQARRFDPATADPMPLEAETFAAFIAPPAPTSP